MRLGISDYGSGRKDLGPPKGSVRMIASAETEWPILLQHWEAPNFRKDKRAVSRISSTLLRNLGP